MTLSFFRERLRAGLDLSHFSSGNDLLDTWLSNHALRADRSGAGRTYVWIDIGERVVAYDTLAPHLVRRADVPKGVGRGSPDVIPSVLLARLALDQSLQGQGLGVTLLADALSVALEAMRRAGGRLIVVDAIDSSAARFYEHHGFLAVPGNPHRLVIKASVASRSLSIPRP